MIELTEIKSLLLQQPNHVTYLSAASGLVQVGPWLYVIADDELHLGKFTSSHGNEGTLIRCLDGELPSDPKLRKAQKPDFEALALIPALYQPNQTALLALGSGSKKNRQLGVVISLDSNGNLSDSIELINFEQLYDHLREELGEINIEGATVQGNDIILFQRGNKKNKLNAAIRIHWNDFVHSILATRKSHKPTFQITTFDLGTIDQIPLSFTDASALPNGKIIFTASAENTDDAYLDGACMGSAIGLITEDGKLEFMERVDRKVKLEGISAQLTGKSLEVLLVSDADDPAQPAKLFSASLKR